MYNIDTAVNYENKKDVKWLHCNYIPRANTMEGTKSREETKQKAGRVFYKAENPSTVGHFRALVGGVHKPVHGHKISG